MKPIYNVIVLKRFEKKTGKLRKKKKIPATHIKIIKERLRNTHCEKILLKI